MNLQDLIDYTLNDQKEHMDDETLEAIRKSTSFNEFKEAISSYWGWEDEQTVFLLEGFILEQID